MIVTVPDRILEQLLVISYPLDSSACFFVLYLSKKYYLVSIKRQRAHIWKPHFYTKLRLSKNPLPCFPTWIEVTSTL